MKPTRQDAAKDELRFAVVMTGGISLAVWMGGVANELNRLVHAVEWRDADLEPYRRLLALTDTAARADVIAGTSAGGINGSVLALSQSRHTKVNGLRDIWVDKGAFLELLRSPLQKDAPSLLRGDDYLLPRLRETLEAVAPENPPANREVEDLAMREPIHLIVTATTFEPTKLVFDDAYGSVLGDQSHRGEFHFVRGLWKKGLAVIDEFAGDGIIDPLALASRTSASFPIAFEPSFIPIGEDGEAGHPDMGSFASFPATTYAMDGGVLVNKPIHPVLRAVFEQPATNERVRRVLAYVVPDPGLPPDPYGASQPGKSNEPEMPSLLKVAISVLSLPRVESIAEDLQELEAHNKRVIAQRNVRGHILTTWFTSPQTTRDRAREFFELYRTAARDRWIDEVILTMSRRQWSGGSNQAELRQSLRQALRAAFDETHPLPSPQDPVYLASIISFLTTWDLNVLERVATMLLGAVQATFKLPLSEAGLAGLTPVRLLIHEALGLLRVTRENLAQRLTTVVLAARSAEPMETARTVVSTEAHRDLDEVVQLLERAAHQLPHAYRSATIEAAGETSLGDSPQEVVDVFRHLVGPSGQGVVEAARDPADPTSLYAIEGLLFAAMIEEVLSLACPAIEQQLELIQISAFTPNTLDSRRTPERKLAGVQMGHFGGFYKRSWRANDWMWGRLDAAFRLAQILLRPSELRLSLLRRYASDEAAEELRNRIRDIALAPGLDVEGEALEGVIGWNAERAAEIEEEVEAVFNLDSPPPFDLPVSHRLVTRRLQIEIARSELVRVAEAVRADEGDGADTHQSRFFAEAVEAVAVPAGPGGSQVPSHEARDLLSACHVGEEKVLEEAGNKLFTRTVTKAAAVATGALHGAKSGVGPIRPLLRGVRGFSLSLWAFARAALDEDSTLRGIALVALAIGGALAGVSVGVNAGGLVALVGAGAIGVALAMLALSTRNWKILPLVLGLAGLTVGIVLLPEILLALGWIDADNWIAKEGRIVFVVAGFTIGLTITGSIGDHPAGWLAAIGGLAGLIGAGIWEFTHGGDFGTADRAILAGVAISIGGAAGAWVTWLITKRKMNSAQEARMEAEATLAAVTLDEIAT